MKLRRLNLILHRDIGYLITGMSIIYALSGIALNHKTDWNSNFIVEKRAVTTSLQFAHDEDIEKKVHQFVMEIGEVENYKTYRYPCGDKLIVLLHGGTVTLNTKTGEGYVQRISKRPFLYQINYLHYNPGKLWKWFSDIFCVLFMLVSITGLFIIKGENGIKWRGGILVSIGILLPILFLVL